MNSIATTLKNSAVLAGTGQNEHSLTTAIRAMLRRIAGSRPEVLLVRDPAGEAAQVREMADSVRASDSRFAAELYAAADRHERLHAVDAGRPTCVNGNRQ